MCRRCDLSDFIFASTYVIANAKLLSCHAQSVNLQLSLELLSLVLLSRVSTALLVNNTNSSASRYDQN